jgi:hypothetical protein
MVVGGCLPTQDYLPGCLPPRVTSLRSLILEWSAKQPKNKEPFAAQDYLPSVVDPGMVGNTAQERRTPGQSPEVFLFLRLLLSKLRQPQTKNPLLFARGFPFL